MSDRSRKIYKYTKKMEKNVSPEKMSIYKRKLDYYRSAQNGGGPGTNIDNLVADLDKRRLDNMKLVNNYETLSNNVKMLDNAVTNHINNTLSMDEYSLFDKENKSLKKEVGILKEYIRDTDNVIDNIQSKTNEVNESITELYTQSIAAKDGDIDYGSDDRKGVFGSFFG